jgi:hypothetical protein
MNLYNDELFVLFVCFSSGVMVKLGKVLVEITDSFLFNFGNISLGNSLISAAGNS